MFVIPELHVITLFLIPSVIRHVMADLDPDISNGTCYYKNGEEATGRYIPCGNEALGHKSCCESLDMCLSSHACYNGQYGVTYLAGCTDPDYQDSSCPDKGDFSDQSWAGLVYCNGTSNEWVACEDGGSTVSDPLPCWCPETSRTVAFRDASRLTDILSLPASLGQSVTWKDVSAYESEHSLTSTSASTSTTIPSRSSSSGETTPISPASTSTRTTATSTSSSASSVPSETAIVINGTSGLSTGQKIGIAFGSAGGAAALLSLVWLLFVYMRRRREKEIAFEPCGTETPQQQPETVQTDPEMRSPAWSGHKSELPADESTHVSPAPDYQEFQRPQSAEVEGSPVPKSPPRPTPDGGFKLPGQKGTYYEMAG